MDELEEYAKDNNIPIMMKDGINFLKKIIKENNVKNVLEIGSAIGYSSIQMCLVSDNIYVTTIERDLVRYNEAIKNIKKFNLEKRINIIYADALDVSLDKKYDLIFIDAAKAQYIKFFEKFKENLNENGLIVTDNLNFHGLVYKENEIKSKDLRGLVRKINRFHKFLIDNQEFNTTFYDIGDGISISKRRKEV